MSVNTETNPGRILSRRHLLSLGLLGLKGGAVLGLAKIVIACGGDNDTTSPPAEKEDIRTEIPPDEPAASSPLEQAIANGRLELQGEQDWENYFVPVTPEEVSSLYSGEIINRLLLPFDPRRSPNLILTDIKTGDEETELGVANLSPGTILYSPAGGTSAIYGFMGESGRVGDPLYLVAVASPDSLFNFSFMIRQGGDVFVSDSPTEPSEVSVGSPLAVISSGSNFENPPETGNNAVLRLTFPGYYEGGSLRELLKKDGKIAFIPQN